jgi:hypothetical protein
LENTTKQNPIGIGLIEWILIMFSGFPPGGAVENEGDMYLPTKLWEIPIELLFPDILNAADLLVILASHGATDRLAQNLSIQCRSGCGRVSCNRLP